MKNLSDPNPKPNPTKNMTPENKTQDKIIFKKEAILFAKTDEVKDSSPSTIKSSIKKKKSSLSKSPINSEMLIDEAEGDETSNEENNEIFVED